MNGLTRDGTAEHVSRDQNLGRERGQVKTDKNIFPVQPTKNRIGDYIRLIKLSWKC